MLGSAGHMHPEAATHLCKPETVCLFLCFRCSSASSCNCRTRSLALASLRPSGTIFGAEASSQLSSCGNTLLATPRHVLSLTSGYKHQ